MKTINQNFINIWEKYRNKTFSRGRECICPNCKETATYNHLIQQANILRTMEVNGKIRKLDFTPAYYGGNAEFKLFGTAKSFGFYGFCDTHDTTIFRPIEVGVTINTWKEKYAQYLLAYRTLAYRKVHGENALKVYTEISKDFPEISFECRKERITKDLELSNFYFTLLQDGIDNGDYSNIDFFFTILPHRIDIACCDVIYFNGSSYFGTVEDREYYITMFFPFENSTIVIIGYNKQGLSNYSEWLNYLKVLFESPYKSDHYCAINNILIGCREQCMSPTYYNSLPESAIREFLDTWHKQVRTV